MITISWIKWIENGSYFLDRILPKWPVCTVAEAADLVSYRSSSLEVKAKAAVIAFARLLAPAMFVS